METTQKNLMKTSNKKLLKELMKLMLNYLNNNGCINLLYNK